MKIAAVYLNQAWEDKDANKMAIVTLLEKTKEKEIDLFIFPEMSLTGFSVKNPLLGEKQEGSTTLSFFQEQTRKLQTSCFFGMSIKEEEKLYNKAFFVSCGEILGEYKKNYLFSYAGEDGFYSRGQETELISFKGFQIGFSICFDLRFPELYRQYIEADLMVNIANWPASRQAHWEALLRARAIENQFYMIGVNRSGKDGYGLDYQGGRSCFSPLGEELVPEEKNPELEIFSLEKKEVQETREKFPFLNEIKK